MIFIKKRENFIKALIMLLRVFAVDTNVINDTKSTFDFY